MALFGAVLALAVVASPASGAPAAASSIPEGAVYELSPFSMTLRLPNEARLSRVQIKDQDGQVQDVELPPMQSRARVHVVELPVLAPHGYRIFWSIEQAGAVHSGSVGFLVRGCDTPEGVR